MENSSRLNQEQTNQVAPILQLAQLNHVQVANTIKDGIINGDVDPLKVHMFLKRVEKIVEVVTKDDQVKEVTISEANKHIMEGKSFDYMGAKLTVAAVHTAYDFSACGDPMWDSLADAEKQIKELKKQREEMLKAAFPEKAGQLFGFTAPKVIVDHVYALQQLDCGEEVALSKPIKYQKTGIKTTFPK